MSFWRSNPPSNRMFPDPMVSGSSVTSGRCCAAAGSENSTIIKTNASLLLIELEAPYVGRGLPPSLKLRRTSQDPPIVSQWPRCLRRSPVGLRWLAPHERERHRGVARRRLVPEFGQRIEAAIEQMTRPDIRQRLDHRVLDLGMLDLQLRDQPLDSLALQAEVAAGRAAAADDRQRSLLG